MALKEQDVVLYSTDTDGNSVIQMPITRIENVEGAVKTVDGVTPDENGNVVINIPTPQAYVTSTWQSGKNWYKKYSNGWIEQGGYDDTDFSGTNGRTISFNMSMTTVCSVIPILYGSYVSNSTGVTNVTAVTTTTFTVKGANGVTNTGVYWYACGY